MCPVYHRGNQPLFIMLNERSENSHKPIIEQTKNKPEKIDLSKLNVHELYEISALPGLRMPLPAISKKVKSLFLYESEHYFNSNPFIFFKNRRVRNFVSRSSKFFIHQ